MNKDNYSESMSLMKKDELPLINTLECFSVNFSMIGSMLANFMMQNLASDGFIRAYTCSRPLKLFSSSSIDPVHDWLSHLLLLKCLLTSRLYHLH